MRLIESSGETCNEARDFVHFTDRRGGPTILMRLYAIQNPMRSKHMLEYQSARFLSPFQMHGGTSRHGVWDRGRNNSTVDSTDPFGSKCVYCHRQTACNFIGSTIAKTTMEFSVDQRVSSRMSESYTPYRSYQDYSKAGYVLRQMNLLAMVTGMPCPRQEATESIHSRDLVPVAQSIQAKLKRENLLIHLSS